MRCPTAAWLPPAPHSHQLCRIGLPLPPGPEPTSVTSLQPSQDLPVPPGRAAHLEPHGHAAARGPCSTAQHLQHSSAPTAQLSTHSTARHNTARTECHGLAQPASRRTLPASGRAHMGLGRQAPRVPGDLRSLLARHSVVLPWLYMAQHCTAQG